MILHLLNHLIHTWLLKVALPEFKNPLIPLLDSLLSQMHRSFSWIMALKRISEEVQSLEHHDFHWLILTWLSNTQKWFVYRVALLAKLTDISYRVLKWNIIKKVWKHRGLALWLTCFLNWWGRWCTSKYVCWLIVCKSLTSKNSINRRNVGFF